MPEGHLALQIIGPSLVKRPKHTPLWGPPALQAEIPGLVIFTLAWECGTRCNAAEAEHCATQLLPFSALRKHGADAAFCCMCPVASEVTTKSFALCFLTQVFTVLHYSFCTSVSVLSLAVPFADWGCLVCVSCLTLFPDSDSFAGWVLW